MKRTQEQQSAGASEPVEWVNRHGDALFAYALLRVRDRATAEDLVQECFLAALDARDRFSGESTERSWLIGILKHKIIDHFRRTARDQTSDEPAPAERTERLVFTEKGFWKVKFSRWGQNPAALLENAEFWEVLRRCLGQLPRGLAEAFTLREIEQNSASDVCQVLGLTETNLWARMHRARLGLRLCLDTHWFKHGGRGDRSPQAEE